ncbi:MAG: c-type cytochrome, partial [Myxococcales bacterium]
MRKLLLIAVLPLALPALAAEPVGHGPMQATGEAASTVDAPGGDPPESAPAPAAAPTAGTSASGTPASGTSASGTPAPGTPGPVTPAPSPASAGDVERGRELFRQRCAVCHGREGRGDGPNAKFLVPRPRALASEPLKLAITDGVPREPTDAELRRAIRDGLPGSAMPRFRALPEAELEAIIAFVRALRGAPAPADTAPEPEARGRALYVSLQCGRCH